MQPMNKMTCPKCGKEHELKPKENDPSRVVLFCPDVGVNVYDAPAKQVRPEKGKEK